VIVLNIFHLVSTRYWKSVGNDLWKCAGTLL